MPTPERSLKRHYTEHRYRIIDERFSSAPTSMEMTVQPGGRTAAPFPRSGVGGSSAVVGALRAQVIDGRRSAFSFASYL